MKNVFNIKSYLTFLSRNKVYTAINVFGLSVSLAFVILIGLFLQQEYSKNRDNPNLERIYDLGVQYHKVFGKEYEDLSTGSHYRLKDELKKYPEVESTCAVAVFNNMSVVIPDLVLKHYNAIIADSSFFNFFNIELAEGNPSLVLNKPNSVVISKGLAETLFPGKDPQGKEITLRQDLHLVVTGVMKGLENTSFGNVDLVTGFDICKHYQELQNTLDPNYDAFGNTEIFILAKQGCDIMSREKEISAKFKKTIWIFGGSTSGTEFENDSDVKLIPLKEIYFSSASPGSPTFKRADKKMDNILLTVAFVILLFAIMNYVNLTMAKSTLRAKEMATRRLMGSSRKGIAMKMIAESICLTLISMALALIFAAVFAPYFGKLIGSEILINYLLGWKDIAVLIIAVVLVGILSGIIPATIMVRVKPIDVVRGSFRNKSHMLFGKVFIVLQNVITIVMLGVSLTMILQCKHLINAPLGYDTSNLMSIRNPEYAYSSDTVENRHLDNFISMIRSQALVRMVSACNGTPLDYGSNYFCTIKGKSTPIQRFYGDSSYFKILNLGLKADYDNFDENGYFINSQAIADYGIKPSDRIFHPFGDDQPDVAPIRGILNDFIIGDITAEQRPVILQIQKNYKFPYIVLIKYSGNPIDAYNVVSKAYSESFHSDFVSDQPRPFVDSQVRHHFKTQLKLSHIVSMFTFVAILISLLGLIAMSTYYIQQRSKEIAVRKVFGSTGKQVTAKLVRSFLMYVAIAFVIAVPIIWYFMGNWLTNYSYRIKLSPWIFIAAGAFTLLISFLAVLFQSIKAANADPIDDIVEKE